MLDRNKCSQCKKSLDKFKFIYYAWIGDLLIGVYCSECIKDTIKKQNKDVKIEKKDNA